MCRILDLARKGEGDIVKISNVDISTESEKLQQCSSCRRCVWISPPSEVAWRQRGESWRADPRCHPVDHKPKNLVTCLVTWSLLPPLPAIVLHSFSLTNADAKL